MREKTVEKRLVQRIEAIGGMCVKFPPLFLAGFPDRIVLLPKAVIIFVETKAPGKVPSKLQEKRHTQLRALGFRVEVIDTLEDVEAFIIAL